MLKRYFIGVNLGLFVMAPSAALAQLPEHEREAWDDCKQQSDQERAIRGCTALLRIFSQDPRRAAVFGMRATAYATKGDHTRAIVDFTQAIQISPGRSTFYDLRGRSYLEINQPTRAIADFDQAILLYPESPYTLYHRGYAHFKVGNYERSIQDLSESIRLNPIEPRSYLVRGSAYAGAGHQEKARNDYRRVLSFTASEALHKQARTRLADLGKKNANERSSGTGILVSANGNLLTNEHVVRGCTEILVNKAGLPSASARVVAVDQANDLALLQTNMQVEVRPVFRKAARLGENVFVYGFPLAGLLATSGNFTAGNITATAGIGDDIRLLQISAPVQPGNSGGPLLDVSGSIVGIVVSKLDALKFANVTKDLPQNVNFAIKSSVAIDFLESHGVTVQLNANAQSLGPADVAERAGAFTLHLVCK